MKILVLAFKELAFRKWAFLVGLLSVAAATASVVGTLIVLHADETVTRLTLARKGAETEALLARMKNDVRKAMLRLGFNVLILPKKQDVGDWFVQDQGQEYMPEEYARRLATSGILIVRHLLPTLQAKLFWPEAKRTVILIGTRGEVPNIFKKPTKPLLDVVAPGTILLGYELHTQLGLKPGDEVTLLGRKFTVAKCHVRRGTKDDVSAWINLREAQEMLGKPGKINAILALECVCTNVADLAKIREGISRYLPNTRAVELGTNKLLARAEARVKVAQRIRAALKLEKENRARLNQRRRAVAISVGLVILLGAGIWVFFLSFTNVRQRNGEIAVFRAVGYRSIQILELVLLRALFMGLGAAVCGVAFGVGGGLFLAARLSASAPTPIALWELVTPATVVLGLFMAPVLGLAAAWVPAVVAAAQDPADILRRE